MESFDGTSKFEDEICRKVRNNEMLSGSSKSAPELDRMKDICDIKNPPMIIVDYV